MQLRFLIHLTGQKVEFAAQPLINNNHTMLRPLPTRHLARQLHTTAARAVRRPQKPFEAYIPRDPGAKPLLGSANKRRAAELDNLYRIAQEGQATPAEKYGETYGLRVPGVESKPSWERKAEWDAERNAALGLSRPRRREPSKPGEAPKSSEATEPADADADADELAALRRKAMQRSEVATVLDKWRSGVDVKAGLYSLRRKERETEAERARRWAERKDVRRAQKAEWAKVKSGAVHEKLQLLTRQRTEKGHLQALGYSLFRAKVLVKTRWDADRGGVVLLADDLAFLRIPQGDLQAGRARVWAAEKARGRTAGPDPTPQQLGQPPEAVEAEGESGEGEPVKRESVRWGWADSRPVGADQEAHVRRDGRDAGAARAGPRDVDGGGAGAKVWHLVRGGQADSAVELGGHDDGQGRRQVVARGGRGQLARAPHPGGVRAQAGR
jgi:hypothetical protein